MKISVEDRAHDLLDRFSVEAGVQDPFARLFVQARRRSQRKVSVQVLSPRSLSKMSALPTRISLEALYKSSLGKISVQDVS